MSGGDTGLSRGRAEDEQWWHIIEQRPSNYGGVARVEDERRRRESGQRLSGRGVCKCSLY